MRTKENHQNEIELIGHYGSDLSHACSAWTSTSRDLGEEKLGRMPKMLATLAKAGHHTPFEKSSLHFLLRTDIATHIQILKHRIGVSVNGESARYKELKGDFFYVPQDWDDEEVQKHIDFCEYALKEYHECLNRLVQKGVPRTRAKESARFRLPYANQLQCDVMFNFRSFIHFLGLRYAKDAQKEIKDLALEMIKAVIAIEGNPFKHTLEAFEITDANGNIREPY